MVGSGGRTSGRLESSGGRTSGRLESGAKSGGGKAAPGRLPVPRCGDGTPCGDWCGARVGSTQAGFDGLGGSTGSNSPSNEWVRLIIWAVPGTGEVEADRSAPGAGEVKADRSSQSRTEGEGVAEARGFSRAAGGDGDPEGSSEWRAGRADQMGAYTLVGAARGRSCPLGRPHVKNPGSEVLGRWA